MFNEFDSKFTKNKNKRLISGNSIDQKIIDAYNIYSNADGWHRDYIYYDLTPNKTKGPFSNDFKDGISSFTMVGDGLNAYNKITQSGTGDPQAVGIRKGNASQWTSGFYDFKVTCLVNGKNGIGTEFSTGFGASGSDIFNLNYVKIFNYWFGADVYALQSISTKKMDLNLPIINWDLNNYSKTIKISIEEYDDPTVTTLSETITQKYTSNFGFDDGVLKKIGLKFGSTSEQTISNTFTRVISTTSNKLGDVTIDFADNVIISASMGSAYFTTREYQTGWYSISFEPFRVQ